MTDAVPFVEDPNGRYRKAQAGDVLKDEAGNVLGRTWAQALAAGASSGGTSPVVSGGDKLTLGDSGTTPPLSMTARSAPPSAPAVGDLYLDDGTNTWSGAPGYFRWNGTDWVELHLPAPASTTKRGSIEIATQAEVDAGTDATRAVTPSTLAGTAFGGIDSDALHDNVAAEINALTEKATPAGADVLVIEDSAASWTKKKVQIGNLPTGGGGGGKPTPTNWGANVQTISGTLTLTDASDTIQVLTASSDAKVKLPAASNSNPCFVLVNQSDASVTISVQDSVGLELISLAGQKVGRFWSDGSAWHAEAPVALTEQAANDVNYTWGGTATTSSANRWFHANGEHNKSANTSATAWEREFIVGAGGTLSRISQCQASAGRAWTGRIQKNGALDQTISFSAVSNESVALTATSYATGDKIMLGVDSSSTYPNPLALNLIMSGAGATHYHFGGRPLSSSTSYKCAANGAGSDNINSTSFNATSINRITDNCAIAALTWTTQYGDSTSTIRIYKNGATDQTVTLSGQSGTIALSTSSYAEGDELAIGPGGTGTAFQYGNELVKADGTKGRKRLLWGVSYWSSNYFLVPNGTTSSSGTSIYSANPQVAQAVATESKLIRLALTTTNTLTSAASIEIWKNGASDQSVTLDASTTDFLLDLSPTVLAEGDLIAVRNTTGTSLGNTTGSMILA